jgi:hypothetical protein
MKARELIELLQHYPDSDVFVREKDGGTVLEVYNAVVLEPQSRFARVVLQFFEPPKPIFRPW